MSDYTLSVYETAEWGARLAGVVQGRYDTGGTLFINEVAVTDIRRTGHFSVLSCVDGSTSVVLSGFLRLVPHPHQGDGQVDKPVTTGY